MRCSFLISVMKIHHLLVKFAVLNPKYVNYMIPMSDEGNNQLYIVTQKRAASLQNSLYVTHKSWGYFLNLRYLGLKQFQSTSSLLSFPFCCVMGTSELDQSFFFQLFEPG